MEETRLVTELKDNEIFVFGSNLSGRHGKGAAKTAMKWGAKYGQAAGIMGNTYGIPTKGADVKLVLPISKINKYVAELYQFASENKHLHFLITEVGCGLAGYSPKDIAPLFKDFLTLDNVSLPRKFINVITKTK